MIRQIELAPLSKFNLDSLNPRLGRAALSRNLTQQHVLEIMCDWSLEELATSFLESGFWQHEAVLCIAEKDNDDERLVVIEGNRRIAALIQLQKTFNGEEKSRKWTEMIVNQPVPRELFENVPFLLINVRSDVDAFLGFRHVTGIKEWAPPEKAQFIAKLIDERGFSYKKVMRKIGSNTPVVERNYIAYSIFEQMEQTEGFEIEYVEKRFSVLFLSLRERSVKQFLGIENKFGIEPKNVKPPISHNRIENLKLYSRWLFGDTQHSSVVKDSRDVNRFARVLASNDGLAYLRSVKQPSLEKAFVIAGGDQEETFALISTATYNVEEALSSIHHFKDDAKLREIVKRLIANVEELKSRFSS